MSERIIGSYDDVLYKSMYTLLHFTYFLQDFAFVMFGIHCYH